MKRKYSDPLVFSGILLENSGGTIGPVSVGQGGDYPSDGLLVEPETFSMNASQQMMTAEPSQIELIPAEGGEGGIVSGQDPVAESADIISADTATVLDQITGDDTAPDTTESGS